ncbi:hypothetical protein C1T31_02460 [Hanstruepera neustonica]|uniref:Chromosome partitioning protein ParA n=1 Tax=Hanstruepera neustonica TaxID=1445657 RepID=A0A2K1E406_9FLAO|nr:hypothetical protein [Hanstruepera neustonica]PNQ75018.1 hypothetical protein C1T31_02460 [Hanstruepera neustonica]
MIVNPQLFNYRLIIGTLVIAIVVLGSYSFSSYNTLKNHAQFVKQEVNLVQNELSDMIALYDEVSVDNNELASQLQQSKARMHVIMDSLRAAKANFPLISKYKSEIVALNQERINLFKQIQTIQNQKDALAQEAEHASKKLDMQANQLTMLAEENQKLTSIVNEVTALKLSNIDVSAIITNRSTYDIETENAHEADNFEVCFTVQQNAFTPEGNKDIYVQILGPDANVVSDRGAVTFGDSELIFSGKTSVNYRNQNLDVCTKINVNQKQKLKKGNYLISVFHDDFKLGSSEIILN